MPFHFCLAILISLILAIPGCMTSVAPKPEPPAPPPPVRAAAPPQVTIAVPHASEIPAPHLERLRRIPVAADGSIPLTLLTVADHFAGRGEANKALDFLDQAAAGFALHKNQSGEATAWGRKALLLFQFNREGEALALIREAGERWKAPPLKAFPAYWEGHRALLQGDLPRAFSLLGRSLQDNGLPSDDPHLRMLRRDTELDAGIAGILSESLPHLLAIYGGKGGPAAKGKAAGETHLRNALALNRELRLAGFERLLPTADFGKAEADAHNFLGLSAWMKGQGAEAVRHLLEAGEWSRKAASAVAEIRGLLFLAELGLQSEGEVEGRRAAGRLLERADHYRASRYRVWSRILLARYEAREGRNREAIGLLRQAAAITEAERSGLKAEMLDQVCRRQRRALYESLVELLAGEGMALEALAAAEKAKSLMTVDLLAWQELGRDAAERERIRAEVALGEEIRGLQETLLFVSDPAKGEHLRGRLKQAEAGYRALLERIGGEDPNLLSLIAARGVNPVSLQQRLDENTTLFDYFTTARGLYVWAIQRGRIHQEKIELPREELRSLVFSFLSAIRDRNRRRTERIARRAYDLLLKPVIPFVSGDRIGFIPDDALAYLPFAAMSYRGKSLVEGFSIFQLPEADLFGGAMEGRGPRGMRILAFGDPDLEDEALDLHHAPRELEQIRKRIGSASLLQNHDASEARVGEMPAGYDILHFAVRGQFLPEQLLDSALLLTPGAGRDGRLTIREIFGLRFGGRGIVLSGGDPPAERDPEGRGLAAMQRALLNTGSPAVITTLWQSGDRAAAHLIEQFYRQLGRKESFADALRTAQLRLLREGRPPHVWAAFVLTGGD